MDRKATSFGIAVLFSVVYVIFIAIPLLREANKEPQQETAIHSSKETECECYPTNDPDLIYQTTKGTIVFNASGELVAPIPCPEGEE